VRALALTSSAFANGPGRIRASEAVARLLAEAIDGGSAIRWFSPRARVAVAHTDRLEQESLRAVARKDPSGIAGQFTVRVRQTGEPAVMSVVWSGLLRLWTSPVYWPYLESHEVSGLLVLPLRGQRTVAGVLTAWREQPRGPFSDDDLTFVQEVARRLALC
jgi:GAF domain-containing protein